LVGRRARWHSSTSRRLPLRLGRVSGWPLINCNPCLRSIPSSSSAIFIFR
jgi:hypothetical protein